MSVQALLLRFDGLLQEACTLEPRGIESVRNWLLSAEGRLRDIACSKQTDIGNTTGDPAAANMVSDLSNSL
jgi:hypothetical protein